ncbi:MAG: hypothetical protein J6U12_03880, partial [Candidatus Methanomethylophilaceae archaeon]|nr:hypothetical protein [Candidatus Methanomethylophilaceae archaeon]
KKESIAVYTVSEIFDGEKESVIGLFSEADRSRLDIDDRSFDHAAVVSQSIIYDENIEEETRRNFGKVLDYISLE